MVRRGPPAVTSGWMIRIWNGKAYETWLCDGGMPSGCAGRYCGSGGISDMDLADPDVVDAGAFRMIVNAALIARYGLPVLGIQKRRAGV